MIKDDMGLPLVKYTYNEWGVCSMTAFNLDNQGAAAFTLGGYIFAVLNGEEPPESSSFPEPSTVPLWPLLITGF